MVSKKTHRKKVQGGLTVSDKKVLSKFSQRMTEIIVPRIVETVEKRRMNAAKARTWQLKC